MFLKRYSALFILSIVLFFSSCGEYQKVLKSTDLDYKLEKALEMYEAGQYAKAFPIFDELLTLYRGTAKAQDVYYYYSMTQFQMKDYLLAAYHFKTFTQTFPNNPFADEAAFMVGYCYYLDSPTYSLDQGNTYKAMNELQLYINMHPSSQHRDECNVIIDELRGKLEKKSFMIAKQYWHTENYKAAIEAVNETLSDYPDTPYREEAMFISLESRFKLAVNSIVSLQPQRFKETQTAYFDLLDLFPQSKYRKEAEKIHEEVQEKVKLLNDKNANTNS